MCVLALLSPSKHSRSWGMLTKLTLKYFKCFERLQLPLALLTLLSGLNAAGKSSALQALALLHQSAVENEWNRSLLLNGRLVALGSAGDVIDKIAGRYDFSIGLESATFSRLWTLCSDDRMRDLAIAIPINTGEQSSLALPTSEGHAPIMDTQLPQA